jgi:ABC-type nitrate/sulfonate/bicarbonate transport system permease component
MESVSRADGPLIAGSAPIDRSANAADRSSTPWQGRQRLIDAALSVTGPLIFVAIWWAAVAANLLPSSVLPSPVTVGAAAIEWAVGPVDAGPYSGTMLVSIGASGGRVAAGFAIAAALGVLIGIPTGFFPLLGKILDPLINLLRPIPVTAWVPLSLVFWGFGFRGAVFLIALGSFFPIVINTIEGVRGASRNLIKVGRMLGATRFQMLYHFAFPAALPAIFVGLRIGIGLSWVLVIVAELMSVKSGIGYTLLDAYSFNRYDVVIAAMILLGVMGFLSDRIVLAFQVLLVRWHREMSIHAE